jgi:hypothetical protein
LYSKDTAGLCHDSSDVAKGEDGAKSEAATQMNLP